MSPLPAEDTTERPWEGINCCCSLVEVRVWYHPESVVYFFLYCNGFEEREGH